MTIPALAIDELSLGFQTYTGIQPLLQQINLCVMPGEIVGLVGESGSGKSLTATACLGLNAPSAVLTGDILMGERRFNCNDLKGLARLRGRELCMIFQNPMNAFNPVVTIGKVLNDIIRRRFNITKKQARERVVAVFDQVHMPDPEIKLQCYPHQLSGGQLQRVMIAAAIACKPSVLIADEPTTALDVTVQSSILTLIQETVATTGMGVLFISHDLAVVSKLCQRVYVMRRGEILESGTVEKVLSTPDAAYTQHLIDSVPELGHPEKLTGEQP